MDTKTLSESVIWKLANVKASSYSVDKNKTKNMFNAR